MEKSIVVTGKTIDLAIEAALNQLGLDRDSVSVQVLAQAKSGFLGFGASPAKVQVTYEVPDPVVPVEPEAPKSALSSASRSSRPKPVKRPEAPKEEPRKAEPKPEPAQEPKPRPEQKPRPEAKPRPEPKQEPKTEAAPRQRPPRQSAPVRPEPEQRPEPKQEPKTYAPAEPGSTEEAIEQFLLGLLKNMNSDAVPHAWKESDDTYRVDLTGEDLGYLIGRRGDTLDAIQHLCNYALNRTSEGRLRISVDAENYRQKREASLRKYARKKAMQVLKMHRRTILEPMNAYERHVIHATLQEMEGITTYSTGAEPNRRVVIEYVR